MNILPVLNASDFLSQFVAATGTAVSYHNNASSEKSKEYVSYHMLNILPVSFFLTIGIVSFSNVLNILPVLERT